MKLSWWCRVVFKIRISEMWGLNPWYSPSRALVAGYKEAERLGRKQVEL